MATAEQYNPFNEKHDEENERLYGKDKKHAYVPIEEVPDSVTTLDEHLEADAAEGDSVKMDEEKRTQEKISALRGELDPASLDNEAADAHNKKLAEQPIQFRQEEGVASIGPDVEAEEADLLESVVAEKVPDEDTEEDITPLREPVSAFTAEKDYGMRNYPHWQKRIENLKTTTPKKRERGLAGILRSWFHSDQEQNPELEELHASYNPNEIPDDPIEYHEDAR